MRSLLLILVKKYWLLWSLCFRSYDSWLVESKEDSRLQRQGAFLSMAQSHDRFTAVDLRIRSGFWLCLLLFLRVRWCSSLWLCFSSVTRVSWKIVDGEISWCRQFLESAHNFGLNWKSSPSMLRWRSWLSGITWLIYILLILYYFVCS